MYDRPSPVRGASGLLDVFWEHEGRLLWSYQNGAAWITRYVPLNAEVRSPRAVAVNRGIQVFWRQRSNGRLALSTWNGRRWKTDACVSPGPILGEPAPIYSMISASSVEVYWRDPCRAVQCSALSPEGWENERISPGPAGSAPAVLPGWTQAFWRHEDRRLIATVWGAHGWRDESLSRGPLAEAPVAVAGRAPDRVDVLWRRASDDALMNTFFRLNGDGSEGAAGLLGLLTPGSFANPQRARARVWDERLTAGPLGSAPAPLAGFLEGRVDVFWRHRDDASLRDTWWTGHEWITGRIVAGPLASAPAPLRREVPNRMDVFWRAEDGGLARTWWTGSEWSTHGLPWP